jgi:hypothetical protein
MLELMDVDEERLLVLVREEVSSMSKSLAENSPSSSLPPASIVASPCNRPRVWSRLRFGGLVS